MNEWLSSLFFVVAGAIVGWIVGSTVGAYVGRGVAYRSNPPPPTPAPATADKQLEQIRHEPPALRAKKGQWD